ncbi:MAG: DUF1365 domain-containing protein [Myxococcota bacterium]|nr:DUF1365 domain-containing protein [Myxococcota bacterium]
MKSCIYEGRVQHRRRRPVEHAFGFPLFMLYLDLEELPRLFERSWLWSEKRPAFARFRRSDHLGDPSLPLEGCVRDLVELRTGRRPGGPIRLLTHMRYAGFAMNPVSIYYCFDALDGRVEAIVAEVNNTPWGERHCYVISADAKGCRGTIRARTPKEFHVSPFMEMDLNYAWSFREPGDRLSLSIANHEPGGALLFEAVLGLKRREFSAYSRARMLIRYPLITLQLITAIYWQAIRLYLAGAPLIPHPRIRAGSLEITS